MLRRLAVLVACVVGVVAAPGGAQAGQPRATEAKYAVGVRVLDLEDTSRATPADPEGQTPVAASDTRKLPTSVYFPAVGTPTAEPDGSVAVADAPAADGGPFPVILFNHGTPGDPAGYAVLLQRWAAEGYVVVAPTFPVSSLSGPDPVAWRDQADQVTDARFVLDRVLELDRVPVAAGGFGGLLDRKHIGVAGHSQGGFTTLALVSDCCRDRRIKAALVLAGISENDPGPELRHPAGPILFAHASYDIAVPFQQSTRAYATAGRPKYLLEIRFFIGGVLSHLLPYFSGAGSISAAVAATVDDFLAAYVRGDRVARREILAAPHSRADLLLRSAR